MAIRALIGVPLVSYEPARLNNGFKVDVTTCSEQGQIVGLLEGSAALFNHGMQSHSQLHAVRVLHQSAHAIKAESCR